MAGREQEILDILRGEPLIPQQVLATRLGLSRAAVAGHIMQLTQQGRIVGRGYVLAADRFVMTVGAANIDITGSSPHPFAPHDSAPGEIRCAPGGVARNVAENLARLGHDVRLISAVGDDLHGASVLEHTRRAGVDIRGCQVLTGHTTSRFLSLHGPDGEMALGLSDMAILEHITPARLAVDAARLRRAAAVLVDCNLPQATLQWLFGQVHSAPVFAEPVSSFKCQRLTPWLSRIHTLKANRLEAAALTGLPVQDDDGVRAAAGWLHAQGVHQVALSLGERGVYWSERSAANGWQAALPVRVVNASGAGDAMMAGLMHGYLQGDTLAQAVVFATGCAALTMTTQQANHANLSPAAVRDILQFPLAA